MEANEQGMAASHPQLPPNDLVLRHRNLGASEDLIIPIQLTCNTSDEKLIANIRENSRRNFHWLQVTAPKDWPIVICGSGPSLRGNLHKIKALINNRNAWVIALNGAAKFLDLYGIPVAYQIIADARPETKDLVFNGPETVNLFASQVDPSLPSDNAEAPHILFHVCVTHTVDEFLELLPEDRNEEFALIGSHGTVGGLSLGVAYAMGFREMHLFGFDSSHENNVGHVVRQDLNKDDPLISFVEEGKSYVSSFSMKQQADVLPRIIHPLVADGGCNIEVYGEGLFPDRWRRERNKTPEQREHDKYTSMWAHDEYRIESPGMHHIDNAYNVMGMFPGERLIDLGCGTGRASRAFASKGLNVIAVDITSAGLEGVVATFIKRPLWDLPMHLSADWGYCVDVMEHIPTNLVSLTLANIAKACKRGVYFRIDFAPDNMGVLIGQPLHMTVKPDTWWADMLRHVFDHVEYLGEGVFVCRHRG